MEDKEDKLFDKFMDKIVAEEAQRQVRAENELEDAPARVHAKRYRELPQNKIVFRYSK